jgi:isopenicillin N synthase-like dioxygenase
MVSRIELPHLPVIDLSLFDLGDPWRDQVAALVDAASSRFGFFQVVGHGIDTAVVDPLFDASRRFFAAEKALQAQLAPIGDPAASPASVLGQVLLPEVPGFREPVLDYTRSLTGLAHKLMSMIARGLLLADSYFVDRYTGNPSTSFRIYNHSQVAEAQRATDNSDGASRPEGGLLTIIKQDHMGGLELQYQDRWIEVPDIPNTFVCAVGATLAQLTNGRYLAAAHRVCNSAQGHRLSMPFCFDVSLEAVIEPMATVGSDAPRAHWGDATDWMPALARRHLG